MTNIQQLENELWEAADQLRANSKLTAAEYAMPVLGPIFLRHADNRFKAFPPEIEADIPAKVSEHAHSCCRDLRSREGGHSSARSQGAHAASGALSPFAALITATGEVLGMTARHHTGEQFVRFLGDVVASQPEAREIHVRCNNVSSHKTELGQAFLVEHANVQVHYTPPTGHGGTRSRTGSAASNAT
jgi:HsdM N-terminal domain